MAVREGLSRALLGLCSQASPSADAADRGMAFEPRFSSLQFRAEDDFGRFSQGTFLGLNHGGEGGIRTLGTLLEYGALAKRCFRPLSHLTFGIP